MHAAPGMLYAIQRARGRAQAGTVCGVGTVSRLQWAPPGGPARASATISITCIADGRAHAVRDTELAMGNSHHSGYYSAVCGHVVTAAPMVAPDGELCPVCAERDASHNRRQRERYV